MKVRKAVIPAAGWGTRFLPVSKTVPKEALPIVDKPVIQYAVEEAVSSGIEHIILVVSRHKKAIEDHFGRNLELEDLLEAKGEKSKAASVRSLANLAEISSIQQEAQLGLGHAVLTARGLVGDEPFAVILPDDVFDAKVPVVQQLLKVFDKRGASVVAVKRISDEEVSRYGIIEGEFLEEGAYKLSGLVEKPPLVEAPSRLAVVGRYVFTPEIFVELEEVKPGVIGEIQLTDGMGILAQGQGVYALEYQGDHLDAGTPLGMVKSSVHEALKRPDMGPDLRTWLESELSKQLQAE